MKKLTTGKVIVEQQVRSTGYLAIPKAHFDSQGLEKGGVLFASVVTLGGLKVLEYSTEHKANSKPVRITGHSGYYRVAIPKSLKDKYPHAKGSRYDVYTSATGTLLYEKLREN